jgi:hypothetical protein
LSAGSPATPTPRSRRRGEPPAAPWGDFPLIQLCVLAALVIGVWGLLRGGNGGLIMVVCAGLLGSVAGLDVALREHLAGRKSHTLVLAGVPAVALLGVLHFAHVARAVLLPAGAATFVVVALAMRELFKRRSGGFGFR